MAHSHAKAHARGHHPEPCDAACRRGRRRHRHPTDRLYRGRGTKARQLAAFRREYPRYSEKRVERIYGATVGKVRRERMARRRRR